MKPQELMIELQPLIVKQTELNINEGIRIGMNGMRKAVLKYFETFPILGFDVNQLDLAMKEFAKIVSEGRAKP